eukprot:gene4681-19428_t
MRHAHQPPTPIHAPQQDPAARREAGCQGCDERGRRRAACDGGGATRAADARTTRGAVAHPARTANRAPVAQRP